MGAEKRQTFFCGFELLLLPSSSSVIFRGSGRAGTVGRVVSRHSRMCEGGKAPEGGTTQCTGERQPKIWFYPSGFFKLRWDCNEHTSW